MTLAPTYEAIRHETSGKPSIEFLGTGHQCMDGLLLSIYCNIYEESVAMIY
jgi:hypothetical protein